MSHIVVLAGREVWLRKAAKSLSMAPSYLSKVLSGKRDPRTLRVGTLLKIQALFEFETIEALIDAIDARRLALSTSAADCDRGDGVRSSHSLPPA